MILLGESKEKTYVRIYATFTKYIYIGVYKNGDKLPSIRQLAFELGINPATVKKAYDLLVEDSLISNVEKSGYYVIYEEKVNQYLLDEFTKLKNEGYKKVELIKYLDKVYGGNKNDWDIKLI